MAAPMRCLISRSSAFLFTKCVKTGVQVSSLRRFHLSSSVFYPAEFDPSILDTVVCPLSKSQLRYDVEASELVNDELGVAYKIIDGIPNLIPEDARMIKQDKDSADKNSDQTKKET
ncbi:protein preY, mitochondrial-like [Patiria miniata]|uniref:Protein preY, mitochondrial n=1 Tax=Patiria miniata TaxID=46514 RepID=A0A914AVZ8_PATMI|nr:protein preY, mitochondrial-like [Patiria miniata]